MIYLLELIPVLGLLLVIMPFGTTAMAAFLGLVGILGRGKSADKQSEANLGSLSFKGPLRLGVIVLAIIFAYIAMQENRQKDEPPSPRYSEAPSAVNTAPAEKIDVEEQVLRFILNAYTNN